MEIIKKIKDLARRGPRKIDGEAPPRLIERSIVATRYQRATIKREPVRGREKGV